MTSSFLEELIETTQSRAVQLPESLIAAFVILIDEQGNVRHFALADGEVGIYIARASIENVTKQIHEMAETMRLVSHEGAIH